MCKIIVTKNSVNSFCSCRRQYDYKVNKRISPKEAPTCYDNAVVLSKAITSVAVSYQNHLSVDDALNAGIGIINDAGLEVNDSAQIEAAFRAYVQRYYNGEDNRWEVLTDTADLGVDVQVSQTVIYHTYINYIVRNRETGMYYVVVNRSSSAKVTDDFMARYLIDNDIRMQVLAAKQHLGVENCGVIINALVRQSHKIKEGETDEEYAARNAARKSKAELKRKVAESRDEFVSRMLDEYPMESLRKFMLQFNDAQLNMAVSNTLAVASDIMSCKTFYPNTSECTKYGKCPYMDLCKVDGDLSRCADIYEIKADK